MRLFALSTHKHISILFTLLISGAFFCIIPHAALAYNANDVLGQGTSGNPSYTVNGVDGGVGADSFNSPSGMAIDPVGHRLFTVDDLNNRVLVFSLDSANRIASTTASYVFGQPDFASNGAAIGRSSFNFSESNGGVAAITYDPTSGRLFVVDSGNSRVLVFDASTSTLATASNGENAEYVLCQTDFTSGNPGESINGCWQPASVAYDPTSGRLFVGDNNRGVLVFDASTSTIGATTTYGENAEYIFGETDFTTTGGGDFGSSTIGGAQALAYDPISSRLFVVDMSYARVLVFDASTSTLAVAPYNEGAEYVFGQTSFTSYDGGYSAPLSANNFFNPVSAAYDPSTGRLFVGDAADSRALVFDASTSTLAALASSSSYGENAEYVFGQTSFTSNDDSDLSGTANFKGLAYDSTSGELFVGDAGHNRVLVFDASTSTIGATTTYGEKAEYVLGQINADGTPSFTKTNINGGPYAKGFDLPSGAVIDSAGHRLFVSDTNNARVLVFNLDQTNSIVSMVPVYVFGQTDFTSKNVAATQDGLYYPTGLAYDPSTGRLFVGDAFRVMVYDASTSTIGATTTYGEDAEYIFDQTDSVPAGFNGPSSLAYDPSSGRLFVVDTHNSRVVVLDASTSTLALPPLDQNVEYVFGQPDFWTTNYGTTNGGSGTTANSLANPYGVAYDASTGRLFVGDNANNRVLVFDASTSTLAVLASSSSYGEGAEYVFGQPDFSSYLSSFQSQATPNGFAGPYGIAYDSASGRLFVGDSENNRVLAFDASTSTIGATTTYGEDAEYVLGQPGFTSGDAMTTQSGFKDPTSVTYDPSSNHLYIADSGNNRVMEYSFVTVIDPELPDGTVGVPYSVAINTTSSQGTIFYSSPVGLLPEGLSFDRSTGILSGTPTAAGSSLFSVKITDSLPTEGTVANIFYYSLVVYPVSVPGSSSGSGGGSSSSGGGSSYAFTTNASVATVTSTTTGMTIAQIKALLASLEAQLRALEAQLGSSASSSSSAFIFTRNLKFGMVGLDVAALQRFLVAYNAGPAAQRLKAHGVTRNFATHTEAALIELQQKVGITPASGYFGPVTRAWVTAQM